VIGPAVRRALLLLVLFGAASGDTIAAPPADWQEVSADGKFTVMAPAGTTFARSPGTDSFTGVFNVPGFAVHVDYGAHVDPLQHTLHYTQYVARDVVVDGKRAKLVTARSRSSAGGYFIGMHVPQLRRSAVGPVGLTLSCNLAREQDYAVLESLYLSVRFN